MRILIVSLFPTHPPVMGNRARMLGLCTLLKSLGHDLHYVFAERDPADLDAMRAFFGDDRLHVVPYRRQPREAGRLHRLWRRLLAQFELPAAYRYGVDDWYDPTLDRFLTGLARSHAFDAVLVAYVFMSRALRMFPKTVLKLIDTHDIFADRHEVFLAAGQWPGWYSTSPAEERKGLRRADVVLAIQDQERAHFQRQLPDRRVLTVGYQPRHSPPIADWSARSPTSLLMVASEGPMNRAALLWFVEQVLPGVQVLVPGVRLKLAGRLCKEIDEMPAVDHLGVVDDLAEVYADAWLAINPQRNGTGLSIKSMEALGHAMPLVATRTGARGLPASDQASWIEIDDDDPASMVTAIVELLCSESARSELSAAASRYCSRLHRQTLRSLEDALSPQPRTADLRRSPAPSDSPA